jgi:iron complex outermembrane recepter protein
MPVPPVPGRSSQHLRVHPRIHPLSALAAAACLAMLAGGAHAQTPGELQVVTVTAERRLENIQQVPNSVSVLQGEVLDAINTGGLDIRGLSGRVPSLNIESSFGRAFPRFYIRGYGNTDFRLNASQPVSLVYDEVVQENPIVKGFPAFDLERVEVLRGPQGTLFGRNTPAGVVKLESVKPGPKFESYGSLSVGTYSTVNLEGAINVPTGESSAIRVSLLNQTRDDWVKNTNTAGPTQDLEGYRDSALRLQWQWRPTRELSALINLHGRDYDGSARLFRANIFKKGSNEFIDGFDEEKIALDGENRSEVQSYGSSLRLRLELGGMALNAITGYESVRTFSKGDIDGGAGPYFGTGAGSLPFPSETADGIPEHSQFTQELRLESTGTDALQWQAGVFAFVEDYKIESFSYNSLGGGASDGYQRVRQKNNAYAAFGNIGYAITPALKLRAGLRYTQDTKTLTVEAYENSGFVPCVLLGKCNLPQLAGQEPDGNLSANPRDSKTNWDLSLAYQLSKDINLYGRVATGFRGSSVQSASAFNGKSVAGAENASSFEAGVKADLFNRRARLNFGLFNYTVKDLQLTAVGGSANANILLNAKKAAGRGFEMDMQALVADSLVASLGLGYNDTEIKDPNLIVSACGNGQSTTTPPADPVPNCTITDPNFYDAASNSQKARIDGNPLPQAPKTTLNFTLRWTQAMGPGELYVFTDWTYRSKINFFLYEAREFTGKPLTEGGLRVGYLWGNGKYEAAGYVRNITNKIVAVGGIDFNNLTGFVNEPRTFGVAFKASF